MSWLDKHIKASGSVSKPKDSDKSPRFSMFRSKTKPKQPGESPGASTSNTPPPSDGVTPNLGDMDSTASDLRNLQLGETNVRSRSQVNEGDSSKTVAWNSFRTALDFANEATDGIPLIGLKAAIGGLIAVIKTFEVRAGNTAISSANLNP